jgi:hypothetical protein
MLNFGATPASGHSSIGCPSSLSPIATPRPSSGPSTECREPASRRAPPEARQGAATWARTRDLRVNTRSIRSGCRPRQCSLSRAQDFQYFRVVRFDFHRLEPRTTTGYWKRFRPRSLGCSAVLSLDLGTAAEQLHALASRRPSPVESGLERVRGARRYPVAARHAGRFVRRSAGGSAGSCRSCGS